MKGFRLSGALAVALLLSLSCGRREEAVQEAAPPTFLKAADLPGLLSGARGKRAVLLVFWATWCPPCSREVPELNRLHEEWAGRGLEIVAVNVRETAGRVADFARRKGIGYKILLDEEGALGRQYGVVGIPLNVLIGPSGEVLYRDHMLGKEFTEALGRALPGTS